MNVPLITPIGVKETVISEKSNNRKVKRSNLSPNRQDFQAIPLELIITKKLSLSELGLSEKTCEILRKSSQSSQISQNLSPFENIVQYLHSQMNLLQSAMKIFGDFSDPLYKELKKICYGCFYQPCYGLPCRSLGISNYCSEEVFSPLFDVLKQLRDKSLELNPSSSQTFNNQHQKKVNHLQKERLNKLQKDVLAPIEEIEKIFECIQELRSKLPEDKLYCLLRTTADQIAGCEYQGQEKKYTLKETLSNFRECLYNIGEISKGELILTYVKAVDQAIELLEVSQLGDEKVLEQYSILAKTWDQIFSTIYPLIEWLIASGDDKKEVETKIQNSGLPIGWIQDAQLVNLAFYEMFNSHFRAVINEIENTYQCQFSETALIDLNVIWKKLCLLTDENAFSKVSSSVNDIVQKLKPLVKNKKNLKTIEACLEKIPVLINTMSENDGVSCLSDFIQSDSSIFRFGILKNKTKNLKEEAKKFESLMKECNKVLQNELDVSKASDDEIQNLKEAIIKFREEISPCLSPILSLPVVLDKLIYNAKRKKIFLESYQPLLVDEIKSLFNVKFRERVVKEEIVEIKKKPSQKPVQIQIEQPIPIPKRPESTKTAVILTYLKEKGWELFSIHSSHLKLKKDSESLIVPISRSQGRLARGTLGAIYRELAQKEERIEARKSV